jgi:hypothetical protein
MNYTHLIQSERYVRRQMVWDIFDI